MSDNVIIQRGSLYNLLNKPKSSIYKEPLKGPVPSYQDEFIKCDLTYNAEKDYYETNLSDEFQQERWKLFKRLLKEMYTIDIHNELPSQFFIYTLDRAIIDECKKAMVTFSSEIMYRSLNSIIHNVFPKMYVSDVLSNIMNNIATNNNFLNASTKDEQTIRYMVNDLKKHLYYELSVMPKFKDPFPRGMPFIDVGKESADYVVSLGDGFIGIIPMKKMKTDDYLKNRYPDKYVVKSTRTTDATIGNVHKAGKILGYRVPEDYLSISYWDIDKYDIEQLNKDDLIEELTKDDLDADKKWALTILLKRITDISTMGFSKILSSFNRYFLMPICELNDPERVYCTKNIFGIHFNGFDVEYHRYASAEYYSFIVYDFNGNTKELYRSMSLGDLQVNDTLTVKGAEKIAISSHKDLQEFIFSMLPETYRAFHEKAQKETTK